MLLFLALLGQAAPPQTLPTDSARLCVRQEVTRLATNAATAEANADAVLTTCETQMAKLAAHLEERFRTDRRIQMQMLRNGKPLPDTRPAFTQAVHSATRANAIEATKRLRAGRSIEGINSTGKGNWTTPGSPPDAATTPTAKP